MPSTPIPPETSDRFRSARPKPKGGHTPGPWIARFTGSVTEVRSQSDGPPVVAWTGFDDADRPTAVHQANARLIAAAPDLLAACKVAESVLTEAYRAGLLDSLAPRGEASTATQACAACRAAIAKAQGGAAHV